MKLYQKKMLAWAEPITDNNIDNLKIMGAAICEDDNNSRSHDAFIDNAKVGDIVVWVKNGKIVSAQARTIEGIHTADLPSRLMKPENGGHPYFCTEQVFQETYIYSGRNLPVNEDDFNEYIHQGS